MMSPLLFLIWIPVIAVAAILVPAVLLMGVAVGIGEAFRDPPAVRPRVGRPAPPELPRKAA